MKIKIGILLILFGGLISMNPAAAAENEVYIIKVADAISPGTAEFVVSGIKTAEEKNAACVIIELDTPGGLVDSMRTIVQSILNSKIDKETIF